MGEKGLTHMDTGGTDADRLGKRSNNWPLGLTTQRSSFVSAKDRLEEAQEPMERQSGVLLEKGSREAGRVVGPRAAFVKVGEAAADFSEDEKDPALREKS